MNNIRRKIKSIEKKTDIDVELKEIVDEMYDIYIKFSCFNILFMSGYYVKNTPDTVENTPVSKLQEEVRVVVDNHLGNREVTDESLESLLKIRENNCTLAESYSRYVDE
ncbi:MAG: hypothetical protein K6G63_03180, partial [Eubacterium sp.]|nr:hypothetical protein [Eubacterium sp.]